MIKISCGKGDWITRLMTQCERQGIPDKVYELLLKALYGHWKINPKWKPTTITKQDFQMIVKYAPELRISKFYMKPARIKEQLCFVNKIYRRSRPAIRRTYPFKTKNGY